MYRSNGSSSDREFPKNGRRQASKSQLAYMVNNIFMGGMTEENCTFLSNSQIHSAVTTNFKAKNSENKSLSLKKKESPQTKYQVKTNTQLSGFTLKSDGDRKSLRPKSSLIANRAYQSKESIRQNEYNTLSSPKKKSEEILETQIELKLAENKAPLQKLSSKPPKSIVSTKALGILRGYSVNSHKYYTQYNEISEARILVVANLTKSSKAESIISLFAIFESSSSGVFVDFLRENFQIEISKLLETFPMPVIGKQLVEKVLLRIEQKFYQFYKIRPRTGKKGIYSNNFNLSFSMMFSKPDEIIVFSRGGCRINICSNLGQKVINMQQQQQSQFSMRRITGSQRNDLDFIALMNEGVWIGSKRLEKDIWGHILRNVSSNQWRLNMIEGQEMHCILGGAVDSIMHSLSNVQTSKNMSLILCGMRNIQEILCLQFPQLELPMMEKIEKIEKIDKNNEEP